MITYGSTTLTSYNSIVNTEVYYYKSTSPTALSGGSWSTTKPTWESGKYVWQKIRTIYEDETYTESDPVNITGQQGATGTAAYSYKLNASDTAVTVSKTGEYSVNKITFTATYKQGTGAVTAYAGRFKIETTLNGTTWTTAYTSSGNESSKEYTIPANIIAIRCSLYQAGGTSILLDTITIPIVNDDRPLVTKTYSGLIGSANDAENASFYFAKIHPTSYTTNYKVKMKVRVTSPEAYAETIDIQFGGYGSTFSSYDSYTTRTGSVGIYFINLYRATQAGISTNHKGHALGVGLRSSSNPTNTSYKRTIIVDILELENCTIEMLDTAVKYADIDGTGSTNYSGLTEMSVATAGQNATNNTNTHYTQYATAVKAGAFGVKRYTLIMKETESTWSSFVNQANSTATTKTINSNSGYLLGRLLYSAGGTEYTSGANTSTVYDAYAFDFRYSSNCGTTLVAHKPVYLIGTVHDDGKFYFDVNSNVWYTQEPVAPSVPMTSDGKVYIYVGMAYSNYQVWLNTENPAYTFYNGEFILYDKATTLQDIKSLEDDLQSQIDGKIQTFYQSTNPASSWDTTTVEARTPHDGDLWYYTGTSTSTYTKDNVYRYNASNNTWSVYSASGELFDKVDGKSTIYYGTTSGTYTGVETGDYLVDSTDGSSYRWDGSKWVKVTDYKTTITNAIDDIEIGGRNLFGIGSDCAVSLGGLITRNFSIATEDGYKCAHATGALQTTAYVQSNIPFIPKPLEKVVFSADIKIKNITLGTTNPMCEFYFSGQTIDGVWRGIKSAETYVDGELISIANRKFNEILNSNEWHRVTVKAQFPDVIYTTNILPAIYLRDCTGEIFVKNVKYERGTQATDWTPAPEDVTRGTGFYSITTVPTAYTTTTGGFTPAYRIALSTVKTESGLDEVMIGDVIQQGYNTYPVGYVDASYVYLGAANSIRGATGAAGLNTARVVLYRRFASAPTGTNVAPTGDVTYTFSTGVAANNLNSWTQAIPSGTDPVYMITASASNTDPTDTIPKTEWSAPVKILENGKNGNPGGNGSDGYNQATIYLYQRKSGTAPSKPSSAVTYTFSTGALSSTPTGWSRTIPANDGNPCYVTTAVAFAKTTTYSIPANGWSDVVILSQDGADGTSITITSTSVKYQKGTSGTTKPTGTWGTSIPTIGENEYLWTQTIVNYSDNSKTESYSVSRNAKNGTDGTSPTVSSTTVEYQQADGGTTPPTGTWSATAPSATAGKYMWTKTTVTYSDGKTAVSYSVSKNGTNGVSVTNVTSTNNTADGGTSVVTITLSDGTTKTFNVKNGTKGNTGATAQWYYGTSLTHTSGTATLVATSTSGAVVGSMYLNTQTSLVYKCTAVGTNNTWTYAGDLTTGVIDNIEIGGRNLLRWTTQPKANGTYSIKDPQDTDGWYAWNSAVGAITRTENSIKFTHDTSSTSAGFVIPLAFLNAVVGGIEYTLSFKYRTNLTGIGQPYLLCKTNGNANYGQGVAITKSETEWKDFNLKLQWPSTSGRDTWALLIPYVSTSGGWMEIQDKSMKIEKGNKATDWTPALEETDASIQQVQDNLDNLEIGGRNLAVGSPGEDWYTVNIVDGTNKPIYLVSTTTSSHSTLLNIPQIPDIKVGDIIQISFDIKFGSNWTATGTGTKSSIIQGNCNNGGSWTNLSLDGGTQKEKLEEIMASSSKEGHINTWFKVTSNLLNGTYTGLTLINIRFDYYSGEVSVKHVMVEKGNKATNWTPSPEDVKYNIQQVQDNLDNLEIGGRNLFKNSKTLTTNWSLNQATVTDGIVTVTPTTNSNRRMYQMPADGYWTWTLGQEYTVSVDARSDNGASFTFDAYGAGKSSNAIFVTSNWQRYSFTFIATTAGGSSMSFSIVETSSKTIQFKEPKLEYGGKATSWTPAPEDTQASIDTAIAQSVEYIIGTQTTTTNLWTGVTKDTSLQIGKTIVYYLPYGGTSSAATLNLTLAGGGTTGAKNVRWNNTNVTTHYPQYSIITLTYDGTYWRTSAYNSDTINRVRLQNVITAAENITAGHIICGTSSGYQNIQNYIDFDLSVPILYAGTTIAKGATTGTRDNNFLALSGVNASTSGTIESGTIGKILYLKGTVSGNTFTITSSPFMTTVIPTSTDGFYYIPLGMMYSTTAIYFTSSNRLYAYLDGAFQPVDIAAILRAEEAKKSATNYMSSDNTGIMVADLKNGEQLPANITQGKNVYITAGYGSGDAAVDPGVYIRDGQTDLAMFGETVRIGKDSSTHGYLYEDYHSLQLVDKERYTYFYVSDLRNAEGYVSLIDTFDGDGIKTSFDLFFTANSTDYTVEVSDNSGGTITKAENWFSFSEAPTANSTITVSYNSESYSLKAYTLGKRKSNERVGGMSVAEGLSTIAKGHYSHAEGLQTEANRYCSHTEGFQTIANGHSAHAENYMTHADGWASHAEGGYTFAKGEYCHAEGGGTEAYGANSHAEGRNTLAKGNYSHAQNRQTIAYGSCQTVIGRYNQEDSEANPNDTTQYGKYALIIGNGNNLQQRSNALCVDWDGNVELALDTSAGSGTTDADLYDAITALGWQNDVIV